MSDPQRKDLYEQLVPLTNKVTLFNLCLKGILELTHYEPSFASTLYQRAVALQPHSPLPHLARLSRLEETDPQRFEVISQLSAERQIYFLHLSLTKAFEEIKRLKQDLKTSEELAVLKETVARLEKEVFPNPVDTPAAFGAKEWQYFFGDVGVEPPLPADIREILSSRCPFWHDKKVQDTHFLFLVPATIDGLPYTFQLLKEKLIPLIYRRRDYRAGSFLLWNSLTPEEEEQRSGTPRSPYNEPTDTERQLIRNLKEYEKVQQVSTSYWILMSKDILPGTEICNYNGNRATKEKKDFYKDQEKTLEFLTKRLPRLTGSIPTLLETVTFSLVWFAKTGTLNTTQTDPSKDYSEPYKPGFFVPRVCRDSPPYPQKIVSEYWKTVIVSYDPPPVISPLRWVVMNPGLRTSSKFDIATGPMEACRGKYMCGIGCAWRL